MVQKGLFFHGISLKKGIHFQLGTTKLGSFFQRRICLPKESLSPPLECSDFSLIIFYCNQEQLGWATSFLNVSYSPSLTKLQLIYKLHVKITNKIWKTVLKTYIQIYIHT